MLELWWNTRCIELLINCLISIFFKLINCIELYDKLGYDKYVRVLICYEFGFDLMQLSMKISIRFDIMNYI